jgi:hypothetical protein
MAASPGGELGEVLDGAAGGQVGRSWQHRGASAVGAAETPRVASRGRCEPPAHGPCLNICTLRAERRYLSEGSMALLTPTGDDAARPKEVKRATTELVAT